jgi:hypothetical protein
VRSSEDDVWLITNGGDNLSRLPPVPADFMPRACSCLSPCVRNEWLPGGGRFKRAVRISGVKERHGSVMFQSLCAPME